MSTFARMHKPAHQVTTGDSSALGLVRPSLLVSQSMHGEKLAQHLPATNIVRLERDYPGTESMEFSHEFSRIPIFSRAAVRVQSKLILNTLGDKCEQEADRVAESVMQMPDSSLQGYEKKEKPIQTKLLANTITPLLQRQSKIEKQDEILDVLPSREVDKIGEGEENELVQTKNNTAVTSQVTAGIAHEIHSLKGKGHALIASERSFFEPRFGVNFAQVRVHTNA